tara:strand:+ start:1441 stop:2601 length:1161 start_codon:yes stop_codon:yes gene_type:complete
MAFNIGAFLGGAAKGGSQVLDERRAAEEARTVTQEQRQWQIATEGRKASYDKKIRRQDKADELDLLVEEASMYYNTDQMAELSTLGKNKLSYAIAQAKLLKPQGVLTEDLYKLTSINNPDDVDAATAPAVPFSSQFATVKEPEDIYTGNTKQGQAIFFQEKMRTTKDPEAKLRFQKLMIEAQNVVDAEAAAAGKPNTTSASAEKIIKASVDASFDTAGLMTLSPTGEYLNRMQSQEPEGFRLIGNAYSIVRQNTAVGGTLDKVLTQREIDNNLRINDYRKAAVSDYENFKVKEAEFNAMPTGSRTEKAAKKEAEDLLAAEKLTSNNFVPLDPLKPLTAKEVRNNMYQTYGVNKVVQVKINPEGDDSPTNIGYVITTTNGIIKLGFK